MRLTRRGWVVAAVALVGTVMAARFGARSLNAVVFPCLVALVAALVQVARTDPPTVDRAPPRNGFPGDTATVTLRFETDSPFTATVADALPAGLSGAATAETTVGRDPVSYEVRYRRRGLYTLGPVTFVARDVLGLASRRFSVAATDETLVYPRVYDLTGAARRDLLALSDTAESHDRDEFDRLREYVRGDSLRDVHWKSSAKREDLIVKEFSADNRSRSVTVSLSAAEGHADEMAEAGATVVLSLLRAGVPVSLATPDGSLAVAPSDRVAVLEHLGRVGHGTAAPDEEPLVAVSATGGGTVVRLGGTETPFDRLIQRRQRSDDGGGEARGSAAPTTASGDDAPAGRDAGQGVAA
jgi:uncharacterized protein (DUF58 family)